MLQDHKSIISYEAWLIRACWEFIKEYISLKLIIRITHAKAINPRKAKLNTKLYVSARYPNMVGAIAPVNVAPENKKPKAEPIPFDQF